MHERELPRARPRNDEAAKRRQVVRPRVSRRNDGRRALIRRQLVGRDADRRAERVGVRVQVDKPRRDELAAGVHDALRTVAAMLASIASMTP